MGSRNVIQIVGLLSSRLENSTTTTANRISTLSDIDKFVHIMPPNLLFNIESFPVWGYCVYLLLNISSSLNSYKERLLALEVLYQICSISPIEFINTIIPGLTSQLLKVIISFSKDSTLIILTCIKILFFSLSKSWKVIVDGNKISLIMKDRILPIIKEVHSLWINGASLGRSKDILDEFHSSLKIIPLKFELFYLECLAFSSRGKKIEGITLLYESLLKIDIIDWSLIKCVVSSTIREEFEETENEDLFIESILSFSLLSLAKPSSHKVKDCMIEMPFLQRKLIKKLLKDGIGIERMIVILDNITYCWSVYILDEFSLSFLLDNWINLYDTLLDDFSPLEERFALSFYRSLNELLSSKKNFIGEEWEYILPIVIQGLSYKGNEVGEECLKFIKNISSSYVMDRVSNLLSKISSDLRFPAIFPRAPLALSGLLELINDFPIPIPIPLTILSSLSEEMIENSSEYTDRPVYLIGLLGVLSSILKIIENDFCFMEKIIIFALNFTTSDYEIIRIRSLNLIYDASHNFPISSSSSSSSEFLPLAHRCWRPLLARIGINTMDKNVSNLLICESSIKVRGEALKVLREHCRIANGFLRDRFLKQIIDRLPLVLTLLSYESLGILMDCLSYVGGNFLQFNSIFSLFKAILLSCIDSLGNDKNNKNCHWKTIPDIKVIEENFLNHLMRLEEIDSDSMFFIIYLFKESNRNINNNSDLYKGMIEELLIMRKKLHPSFCCILDDK